MSLKFNIEKQALEELYLNQKLSGAKIATRFEVNRRTIYWKLKELGIPIRSGSECNKGRYKKPPISSEELFSLYYNQKRSLAGIGRIYAKSGATILSWFRYYGIPRRTITDANKLALREGKSKYPKGENSPTWKGGRRSDGDYIRVKAEGHPRADSRGYIPEHILIWERTHNKPLPDGWLVHHINGIKNDNRPRNLLAMPKAKHHSGELVRTLKQRIRELEQETKLLEKALDSQQMIFRISEN